MAGESTQYPGLAESIASTKSRVRKGHHSIMPLSNQSPLARRAANQRKMELNRNNHSITTRISENINNQKFTTSRDAEAEKIRLQNEENAAKRNMTSAEPFWTDFNPQLERYIPKSRGV